MNTSNEVGYVDGFVLVVPRERVEEYKKMAAIGKEAWLRHGALSYKECRLEDGEPDPENMPLTFAKLAGAGENETVWFSYIEFKSRAHRDEVNKKVMADPAMHPDNQGNMDDMPFEMKRMAYGGFEVIV